MWTCVFLKCHGQKYISILVLCQLECPSLHKTVNMVVFFLKMMKIPIQKKGDHVQSCLSNKKRELLHIDRDIANLPPPTHRIDCIKPCIKFNKPLWQIDIMRNSAYPCVHSKMPVYIQWYYKKKIYISSVIGYSCVLRQR